MEQRGAQAAAGHALRVDGHHPGAEGAGGQTVIIFALGIVFVFLVLAAQYESFVLPFVVILAVPLAMLGRAAAQASRGLANDVFCQVGLVMLVGLASKNAILIVEFAEQLRERGRERRSRRR